MYGQDGIEEGYIKCPRREEILYPNDNNVERKLRETAVMMKSEQCLV